MEWISINDGLPENDVLVDVICEICSAPRQGIVIPLTTSAFTDWKFVASFHRSYGWKIYCHPDGSAPVKFWRNFPSPSKEESLGKDLRSMV